jgi:hypothetical protein
MNDLEKQLQNAINKAAEFDLLASLATDPDKLEECRIKAQFYHDAADELRKAVANAPPTDSPAALPESKPPPDVVSG